MAKIQIILLLVCSLFNSCCNSLVKETVAVRIDTVLVDARQDSILIESKADIIYIKDTIIQIKPYIASKDTIIKVVNKDRIKFDTVKIRYSVPDNQFRFIYRPEYDSTFKEIQIKTITKYIEIEPTWAEIGGYILLGILFSAVLIIILKVSK